MEQGLESSVDLFSALVNVCMAAALVIGGARLVWLFLSPVPRPVPALVERPRLLTLGRFAPLLLILGCAGTVAFTLIILWLKSAPSGWQNIFPFLVAYVLGIGGLAAILCGISAQTILSDAYRGFDIEAETGNLQRNFDAALLAAFAVVMFAVAGWHWVSAFDPATADSGIFDAQRLIVRGPLYLVILSTVVRTYYAVRDSAPDTGKAFNRVATWAWVLLFFVADHTFDGVLPRSWETARYLDFRGNDSDLTLKMIPIGFARAEMLALIGLALVMTLSATTLLDTLARRGVSNSYVPKRVWPGLLFLGLALAVTFAFTRSGVPLGAAFSWGAEVALPIVLGMALIFAFPVLWRGGAYAWANGRRFAKRNLAGEFLVFGLLLPPAVALLYAASQLTRLGFASLLLGTAAAATLGWLRLPAPAAPAERASAVVD